MPLNRLHPRSPSLRAVAALAIGTELAPVKVGVAVLALLAHIREYRLKVAGPASHGLVHAAQRVPRVLVVLELGSRADRPPTRIRVAVLAEDLKLAVGTSGLSSLRVQPTTAEE